MRFTPRILSSGPVRRTLLAAAPLLLPAMAAHAQIQTTPTTDTAALKDGLRTRGLVVDSIVIRNGQPGQFGTYTNFSAGPVTIQNGIVMSSGNVTNLGPISGATDPGYDPSNPPPQVNNQMNPEPDSGGTAEFDTYGAADNHIESFQGSFDVAAITVTFTLAEDSQVKFDFVFGSVEFPYWTSQFTDAFLVFLDGTDPINQVTFDAAGKPVQVGRSFADLTTIDDVNTAFSNPHGLIHHLTTTTDRLDAGTHTLVFEVGDVNDHILDSAVFFTNLRAEAGNTGTEPSEDACSIADIVSIGGLPPPDGLLTGDDFIAFINAFAIGDELADVTAIGGPPSEPDDLVTGDDFIAFINTFAEGCH